MTRRASHGEVSLVASEICGGPSGCRVAAKGVGASAEFTATTKRELESTKTPLPDPPHVHVHDTATRDAVISFCLPKVE